MVSMATEDTIRPRAREDLVIVVDGDRDDVVLWERAVRVSRSAIWIADLPEASDNDIDRRAVLAAALYHDAGWAIQFRDGRIARAEILDKPTSDKQRELAVGLLSARLADLLSPGSMNIACQAVREANRRDTDLLEARILSDAVNLDEIGMALWQLVWRHTMDGTGVEVALDTWQRQNEYGYWDARIKRFRYEPVRQKAVERLTDVESYMLALARHHFGPDVNAPKTDQHDRAAGSLRS